MFAWITIPTTANSISSTTLTTYSSAMFDELLPYMLVVVGFSIGALLVRYLIGKGLKGASKIVLGGGRRGGRRRRR